MKRTRTITLLLIITALLTALCSCTAAEDPFDADTTEKINAETEYPGDEKPDPAFYSLTEEKSFEKYGIPEVPGGCLLSSLSKGAVLMNKYFDYYRSNDSGEQISTPMICNFAEFDLKSGKIFKYRKPAQEELAEKYAAMYGM